MLLDEYCIIVFPSRLVEQGLANERGEIKKKDKRKVNNLSIIAS
tara:strand:- start:291 stop:422 length:132 start_codon:yes stop_codon:yes gene_type:complete